MRYRVVQWSTGNVGRHTIAGHRRPARPRAGRGVGVERRQGRHRRRHARRPGPRAGRGRRQRRRRAAGARTRLHRAHGHGRQPPVRGGDRRPGPVPARRHRRGVERPGVPPVARGRGRPRAERPGHQGGGRGRASLFVNGVDPGFANDVLPLPLTGISERIDQVRCVEVLNYNTYDQAMVLFDIMGFGGPMDKVPFILSPGVLTTAWGSVVRQIAAGLDVELDGIEEVARAGGGPRRPSRSTPGASRRARPPACTSRSGA